MCPLQILKLSDSSHHWFWPNVTRDNNGEKSTIDKSVS